MVSGRFLSKKKPKKGFFVFYNRNLSSKTLSYFLLETFKIFLSETSIQNITNSCSFWLNNPLFSFFINK